MKPVTLATTVRDIKRVYAVMDNLDRIELNAIIRYARARKWEMSLGIEGLCDRESLYQGYPPESVVS